MSKHRGKVDPEHRARLDAYSFADAFSTVRRKSSQALSGIISPGGTKSQSRRVSCFSHTSKASKDENRSILGTPGLQDPDPSYESLNEYQLQLAPTSDEFNVLFGNNTNEGQASSTIISPKEFERFMPSTMDDGARPHLSYAQLAAMAILHDPKRKLNCSGIYEWISNTFSFYRLGGPGKWWQGAVRTALMNHDDIFTKVGRFGSWTIQPGKESLILRVTPKHDRKPKSSCNRYH